MVDEEVDLYLDVVVAATNSPGEADNSNTCITMAVAVEIIIFMIAGVIMAKVEDQQPITTTIKTIIIIILKAVPRETTMKLVVIIMLTTMVEDHNGDRRKP